MGFTLHFNCGEVINLVVYIYLINSYNTLKKVGSESCLPLTYITYFIVWKLWIQKYLSILPGFKTSATQQLIGAVV